MVAAFSCQLLNGILFAAALFRQLFNTLLLAAPSFPQLFNTFTFTVLLTHAKVNRIQP